MNKKRIFDGLTKTQRLVKKRNALGLCHGCGKPARLNKRTCLVCYDKSRQRVKKLNQKNKKLIFLIYGAECICCNESDLKFLTLDHVNNDGKKHRRSLKMSSGSDFYKWVIKHNFPDFLQTLCYNCNIGKYRNNGICPHEEKQYAIT